MSAYRTSSLPTSRNPGGWSVVDEEVGKEVGLTKAGGTNSFSWLG